MLKYTRPEGGEEITFKNGVISTPNCPIIPYECTKIYWSIDDPSTIKGSKESKLNIINTIRDEIRLKVKDFIISNKL